MTRMISMFIALMCSILAGSAFAQFQNSVIAGCFIVFVMLYILLIIDMILQTIER